MDYINYLVEYKNYLRKMIVEFEEDGQEAYAHREELRDVDWELNNLINREDPMWEE